MQLIRTLPGLRQALDLGPRTSGGSGSTIALVPTMGALHEGHLSLVRAALARSSVAVVSIFVNPLQFGPAEDFAEYPRDLDRDLALLSDVGADLVFAPEAREFTPPGRLTTVHVAEVTDVLEGARRPGHFDGVATIVTKLFCCIRPDVAMFGEKDYQQLVVIRQMVADLNLGVEVVGCPTVRESSGLALSSRNAYLTPGERESAAGLYRALVETQRAWNGNADEAREHLLAALAASPGLQVDYAEIADARTLQPLGGADHHSPKAGADAVTSSAAGPARALVAAFVGRTRLIDNVPLPPEGGR